MIINFALSLVIVSLFQVRFFFFDAKFDTKRELRTGALWIFDLRFSSNSSLMTNLTANTTLIPHSGRKLRSICTRRYYSYGWHGWANQTIGILTPNCWGPIQAVNLTQVESVIPKGKFPLNGQNRPLEPQSLNRLKFSPKPKNSQNVCMYIQWLVVKTINHTAALLFRNRSKKFQEKSPEIKLR